MTQFHYRFFQNIILNEDTIPQIRVYFRLLLKFFRLNYQLHGRNRIKLLLKSSHKLNHIQYFNFPSFTKITNTLLHKSYKTTYTFFTRSYGLILVLLLSSLELLIVDHIYRLIPLMKFFCMIVTSLHHKLNRLKHCMTHKTPS